MLTTATPDLPAAIDGALSAIARCRDVASRAGCRPARVYLDGAAGNLRQALAELVHRDHRLAHLRPPEFDSARVGGSEVFAASGCPDTITACRLPGGGSGLVRALAGARDVADVVWVRPDPALPGLHVRGRVTVGADGCRFEDAPDREDRLAVSPMPDLGCDLMASGLDLSGRPVLAIALEVALATGSWMHLASGRRWFADQPTARAVVRLLGGCCGADPFLIARLGVCVDREVLLLVEALGWRHWPTPASA